MLCCSSLVLQPSKSIEFGRTVAQPFQQALLKRVCIYNHSGLHIIEVLLYTVKPVGQYSLCDGHYLYSINSPSCRVKEKGVYWCCRNHSWLGIMLRCYPANRGFSLAWLLGFTKSFTWLVCHAVGLFTPPGIKLRNRQPTRMTL